MTRNWTRNLLHIHGVLAVFLAALALPASSFGGVFVNITIAPPALPVYVQPVCPGPDYIWTPGYWAYGPDGYFWVPGTWVTAPRVGLLWTPGYWGLAGGVYGWHAGYWGPHVGFYGGVNYGFGYFGAGFGGGAWVGGHFSYNTAVANVNTSIIHNTYVNRTVIVNNNVHTSFNGPGGITRGPSAQEAAFGREQHVAPSALQASHERAAGMDRNNFASFNHGRPANTAMAHPMGEAHTNSGEGHTNAPAGRSNPPAQNNHAAAHNAPRKPAPEHNEERR